MKSIARELTLEQVARLERARAQQQATLDRIDTIAVESMVAATKPKTGTKR